MSQPWLGLYDISGKQLSITNSLEEIETYMLILQKNEKYELLVFVDKAGL
jgi:hypothetical protein